MPTFIFFKNKAKVADMTGANSKKLKEIVAALEGELVRVEDVGERRSPASVESFLMKLYGQTWRADAAWEGWQGTLGET